MRVNENYANYDAAVAQATGIVNHLRRTFDMDTIRMAFNEVLNESVKSKKKSIKEAGKSFKGTDPDFWEFLDITFNGIDEYDPYTGSYDELVHAVRDFVKDWTEEGMGEPGTLRYTGERWLAATGRSLCADELNGYR